MKDGGSELGKYSPCLFHDKEKNIRTWVHGDDFVARAPRKAANAPHAHLQKSKDIRVTGTLGFGPEDQRETRVLNIIVRITAQEGGYNIEYESDPRHVQIMLNQFGLGDGSKAIGTPGVKMAQDEVPSEPLSATQSKVYTGAAP
eukprot:6136388-Heterocapsa_arctica.AAC.2